MNKRNNQVVGVVGLGSVGWSVIHGLSQFYKCVGYDIIGDHDWNVILNADIVFITVSTPEGSDQRLDCSNVDDVLARLNDGHYRGVVVVKSTVGVGFMDDAQKRHPSLRLVYMPEFLRERSSYSWFLDPDRIVISGKRQDADEAITYFDWVKGVNFLYVSHRSAELGKLAHNALIATKVSFTNEIATICNQLNADAEDVMNIVCADRRVISKEHLRPGLGPYGGKCVPKDTRELIHSAQHAVLLDSVEKVNISQKDEPLETTYPDIVVLIPTKNRSESLNAALKSIEDQSRLPTSVIIISDCDQDHLDETKTIINEYSRKLKIDFLRNNRTKNLSGALNTGLIRALDDAKDPESTFIAILDDDDTWEPRYIDNCIRYSAETNSDWVISGIVRHTGAYKEFLTIPSSIQVSDFLVGNPNVQGSNLFVKLNRIMSAGMFDETLVSTTDRDMCIRLLKLNNIHYSILRNHLVHHFANDDPSRLSFPGSSQKREGLKSFYEKYKDIMNDEQKTRFKARARDLFGIVFD